MHADRSRQPPDRKRHLALGGFMGVGKSTVGARVAGRLGLPFVDLDAAIEARHGPIPAIFAQGGESAFRKVEAEVLAALLGGPPCVLATGGGAWVSAANRVRLREAAFTVTLHAPFEVLAQRVGAGAGRPLWDADARRRYDARQEAYLDADAVVDVADASVDAVVERVVGAWARAQAWAVEPVALGDRSYEVWLTDGLVGLGAAVRAALGGRPGPALLVTDDAVGPRWAAPVREELRAAGYEVHGVTIPGGEAHKGAESWLSIVDAALGAGLDRRSPILALGGGVVGDLAGFAAASVNRGAPWVQVPTTLLAMVDASVGGKTGFNHRLGKNLVGAFHQPSLVWGALDTLDTLPLRERAAGLAEVVKHAVLDGDAAFAALEADAEALATPSGDPAARARLAAWVAHSVRVKARVVESDERETGRREILNLGHTVAHGIEAAALRHGMDVRHGEAVMVGLVAEARWAACHLGADPTVAARLAALGPRLGLPVTPPAGPPGFDAEAVAAMAHDKKRAAGEVKVPFAVTMGEVTVARVPVAGPVGLASLWQEGTGRPVPVEGGGA